MIWSDDPDVGPGLLNRIADERKAEPTGRVLIISPGTATRWAWTTSPPSVDELRGHLAESTGVRIALAGPGCDLERVGRFVRDTLGELETSDPQTRDAVLTFIQAQCNAALAARRLFIHRNTLLRRLDRAERLLPRPLAECSVDVAVALEGLICVVPPWPKRADRRSAAALPLLVVAAFRLDA